MKGGYVGLMNCVFAAQKAVSEGIHGEGNERYADRPERKSQLTSSPSLRHTRRRPRRSSYSKPRT